MPRDEVIFLAFVFAALIAGWALGQWHNRLFATRVLGKRVAHLEREYEALAVEVARIDSTALLWQPPTELPVDAGWRHDS